MKTLTFTASLLLALAAAELPALATCGAANCFLSTGTREGLASRGSFGLDLSYRYVDQSRKLSGTDSVGEVLTPEINFEDEVIEPFAHREVRTQNTLMQLDADYGVTERLTLSASFPYRKDVRLRVRRRRLRCPDPRRRWRSAS